MPTRIKYGGLSFNRVAGRTLVLAAPPRGFEPAIIPLKSQPTLADVGVGTATLAGLAPTVNTTTNALVAVAAGSIALSGQSVTALVTAPPTPPTFRCSGL